MIITLVQALLGVCGGVLSGFAETEKVLFTLPFVFDVISDVEVKGDVSTDTGRPVLSDVWLGHLHDRKRHYGLCHSSPSSKHHSSILRLPA